MDTEVVYLGSLVTENGKFTIRNVLVSHVQWLASLANCGSRSTDKTGQNTTDTFDIPVDLWVIDHNAGVSEKEDERKIYLK